jgi:hypothetical protein
MEDEHNVHLFPLHHDLDSCCFFGVILVHSKCVDVHASSFMTIFSLCSVDGNMHQP